MISHQERSVPNVKTRGDGNVLYRIGISDGSSILQETPSTVQGNEKKGSEKTKSIPERQLEPIYGVLNTECTVHTGSRSDRTLRTTDTFILAYYIGELFDAP